MQGSDICAASNASAPYAIKYTYAYPIAQVSSNPREILPRRIAAERDRKGWSQAELTQHVTGKARSATASDWENGKNIPDAVTLAKLAEVLEVSADYLLGRANTPQEEGGGAVSLASIIAIYDRDSMAADKRADGLREWAIAVRIAEEEGRARREGVERATTEGRKAEPAPARAARTREEIREKKERRKPPA